MARQPNRNGSPEDEGATLSGPRSAPKPALGGWWSVWRSLFRKPESPWDSHSLPRRIGRYRVLELLGEGGMGRVFVAEDEGLQRRVALKVLKEWDDSSHRRFLREARTAARISHPNVCPIFEIGEEGGRPFLATELLSGETLAKRLERGALPVDEALALAQDMLGALGALHEARIIHRDVKPSNVFLTSHGAKLLDFGLARPVPHELSEALTSGSDITRPGVLVGTPSYMAPEQILGRRPDERTDLFAAGVVLYEALTGRRPFPGDSTVQVLSAILHEEPSPLTGTPAEAFAAPLGRALAKPPDQRFRSAGAMADAIHAVERVARSGDDGRPSTREVFVGRQAELEWLQKRLAEAVAGNGSVVFVTGEGGVGKSALVREFRRRARSAREPISVVMGRCVEPQGPGEPFQPFTDAIHRLLTNPRSRETADRLLREHAPTAGAMMPQSLLPDPGDEMRRRTVGATKQRYYREAGDFLEAASRETPTVLHIEDLQWADPASIECLHHMGCRIGGQRTLLVCTYRHSDVDAGDARLKRSVIDLVARGAGRELTLGALSSDDVQTYLDARFSDHCFPESLAGALHERTEGLALFTRSLVDFLQERGEIVREESTWRLARRVEEMDLEPSRDLQDLVRQRVGSLPDAEQKLIRFGSVCGRDFLSNVVARLAGLEELDAEERLSRLCSVHRLIIDRGEEELPDGTLAVRYHFAHALYQTVLYQELVPSRRVQLHRQVAERLQQHWGSEAPLLGAEMAQHCERGRDFEGAIDFRLHAGETAVRRFAYDEADDHYEWASQWVEKLPPASRSRAVLELHRRRGGARLAQGRFEQGAEQFQMMLARAREVGSVEAERLALSGLCDALMVSGRRVDEVAIHAQELLDVASRSGDEGHIAEARSRLVHVLVDEGRLAEAIILLEDVSTTARSCKAPIALLMGLFYRGLIHYFQGEFEAAEGCFVERKALAIDRGTGLDVLSAWYFVSLSRGSLGRVSEALNEIKEAIAMARSNGDRFILPRLLAHLGSLHSELFGVDAARDSWLEALRLAPKEPMAWPPAAEPLTFLCVDEVRVGNSEKGAAFLAELEQKLAEGESYHPFNTLRLERAAASHWAARGEWPRAKEHAGRLRAVADRLGARVYLCVAERIRAEAALERGEDLEEPARRLTEALEELSRFPAPFETWKAARLLGQLRRRLGDEPGARHAFADSARAIRAIAAGVTDGDLRDGFLSARAVREVLDAAPDGGGGTPED